MGKMTITRTVEFDAGHRLLNHESKCANLHGHRYKLEATFTCEVLDSVGRVIDFSVIKERIKTWIDDNWDHNFIVNKQDHGAVSGLSSIGTKKKIYLLEYNPTAENMVFYLGNKIIPFLFKDYSGINLVNLRLYETPNCWADYSL